MIQQRGHFRYQRLPGFATVAIPFRSEFDLVILLPDEIDGLPGLQRTLEPAVLAASTQAFAKDVRLTMPVFRLESPALLLKRALGQLGVRSVFDVPEGSADLTRMAPRPGGDYLALSEAWHRAEIQVDRLGVEGSAGMTVPPGTKRGPIPGTPTPTPVPPIEFRVDHPFLFALLHRPSGACLFLGRVAQLDGTNAPRAVAAFPTPAPAQDGIRELILDFDAPEVEPDDEAGAEVRTEPR